jgi:hypothetical protein
MISNYENISDENTRFLNVSRIRFCYNFLHEKLVQDDYIAENVIEKKNLYKLVYFKQCIFLSSSFIKILWVYCLERWIKKSFLFFFYIMDFFSFNIKWQTEMFNK